MAQPEERNGFTFYRSYYEAARELSDKQRLALYDAIIQYGIEDVEPELSGVSKSLFILIKPVLDKSKANSKAGAKGGKANGKRNGSENEAETKRKRSGNEADAERTERDISEDVDDEIDTDKDIDNTPPNPPAGRRDRKAEIMEIWESYRFPPELERAVWDWGRYKKEKRQEYQPEGLKNLLSTIRNRADEYGDTAVIALIRESMAANYTGITWSKLQQTGGAAHGRTEIAGGNNQQQGFNPAGLAGFRNALDRYDDEGDDGNEIGADGE